MYAFLCILQEALEELDELKKIVPGEALVYFLLSKVGWSFSLAK